uniref:Uncharacterized protein n=1 Tax=Oryza glumipatula TaxID=40148 RepID=A0A0E0ALI4_9ORYZ
MGPQPRLRGAQPLPARLVFSLNHPPAHRRRRAS